MAMRGLAIALVLASLSAGCNTRQRVAGGGAGLAVVGLALTYSNDTRSEEEVGTQGKIGIGCLLTGLAVLFVAAALDESAAKSEVRPTEIRVSQTPPPAPVDPRAQKAQQRRDEAWALTKQAQDAARAGDCAKVTALSAQVGGLDAEFYGDVFMQDVAIQRCFVPATPATPADPAPPVPAVTPPVPPEPAPAPTSP